MKIKLFALVILAIVSGFKCDAQKKYSVSNSSQYLKLSIADDYSISDDKGKALDAKVFLNHLTITGKKTRELIVYFNLDSEHYVVTIALDAKLIGIPEQFHTMKGKGKFLVLKKASLIFTPVNNGIEKMIKNFHIDEEVISFDAFDKLFPFAQKIIIHKTS